MDPASLIKNNFYLYESNNGVLRAQYVMHTLNYRIFHTEAGSVHLADSSVKTNIHLINDETEMG